MDNGDPNIVVSEFRVWRRTKRVTADLKNKTVCFENCHTPRKLLATVESNFTCPISEILETHELTHKGRTTLTIVTSSGRALIPEGATNFRQMKDLLSGISKITPGGPAIDHPMMAFVYLLGALIGLAAGPLIVAGIGRLIDPDFTLGSTGLIALLMFLGAAVGVVVLWLTINTVDRVWSVSFVLPIGFGMLGVTVGLSLAGLIAPWIGWSGLLSIALPLTGGAAGIAFGVFKEKKRKMDQARHDSKLA